MIMHYNPYIIHLFSVNPVLFSQKYSNVNALEFVSLAAMTRVWFEGCGMLLKLMFTHRWIPNSLYWAMKVLRVTCHPSQNAPRAEN